MKTVKKRKLKERSLKVIGKPVVKVSGHPVVLQRLIARYILRVINVSGEFLWVSVHSAGQRRFAFTPQLKMSIATWMEVVKSAARKGEIVVLDRGTLVPASFARLLGESEKRRALTSRSLWSGATDSVLLKDRKSAKTGEIFGYVEPSKGGFQFKDSPKPKPRPRPPWEERPGPMRRKRND